MHGSDSGTNTLIYSTDASAHYEGQKFVQTTFHVNSAPTITIDLIPSVAASSLNRIEIYRGLDGCHECYGEGVLKSGKACKLCVKRTGNCNVCKNTGIILNVPGKKCKCIWGNDR